MTQVQIEQQNRDMVILQLQELTRETDESTAKILTKCVNELQGKHSEQFTAHQPENLQTYAVDLLTGLRSKLRPVSSYTGIVKKLDTVINELSFEE